MIKKISTHFMRVLQERFLLQRLLPELAVLDLSHNRIRDTENCLEVRNEDLHSSCIDSQLNFGHFMFASIESYKKPSLLLIMMVWSIFFSF